VVAGDGDAVGGGVLPGRLLLGISLGGRVLGVAVPVGYGLATVAEVPELRAVPVALGVELPVALRAHSCACSS
jgi:hypothetical protein